MSKLSIMTKGIIKENPVFVFLLGMCPTLAVTSSVESAIGMGILVFIVLLFSNIFISLVKNIIPDEIRIPCFIVIIATFVTVVQMLTNDFAPELAATLGVFIPLIVVNCIILGRAESFASKNSVFDSALDAIGTSIGFMLAIVIIGFIRELLATGAIAYGKYLPLSVSGEFRLFPAKYGATFFSMPAGSFLVLAVILAVIAMYQINKEQKKTKEVN